MTASWRKAVRGVWRERTRALLVALSIAIGLAAFLAVLSTYAVLRRELNLGYLATNPASAVLWTDRIDEALIAEVVSRGGVSDADARRVVNGRLRAAGAWRRLTIFVIRDFTRLRLSTFTSDGGEWPPSPGSMLIERDAFQVAKAAVGDIVTIETKAGGQRTVRVSGRVHDVGQAQARMENAVYAYVTPETAAQLGVTSTLDRLYVLAADNRSDKTRVRRIADEVKSWLESRGHAVRRVDVPTPGEHPHAALMGLLLLLMAGFGLVALALGGVIAANLILAVMASERRQIGVMKAVGATRGQIARLYLAEAAFFGAVAVVVATPLGIAVGRTLERKFAVLLNFDLTSRTAPVWVYLIVGVVGLLVPIAAAAHPVLAATAITVREAVAPVVNAASVGSLWLDRLLSHANGAARPWLLGVRNSARRPGRTALTLVTLGLAGSCFMTAINTRTSIMAATDRLFGAGTYGADFRYAIDQHMLMIYIFLVVMSGVLGTVGCLGLMTATSLNVLDRRRELGVLRAIGAPPSMVATIVVVEAVSVAAVAWMLALVAAWPISALIGRFFTAVLFKDGVVVRFAVSGVAGWLGISLVLALVSSFVPAAGVSRRSIREVVSHE